MGWHKHQRTFVIHPSLLRGWLGRSFSDRKIFLKLPHPETDEPLEIKVCRKETQNNYSTLAVIPCAKLDLSSGMLTTETGFHYMVEEHNRRSVKGIIISALEALHNKKPK